MMRQRRGLCVLLVGVCCWMTVGSADAEGQGVGGGSRVEGASRVETAVAVSRRLVPQPCEGVCPDVERAVVLATSADYVDAVVAAPLAALMNAPILLSPGEALHPAVAEEVERLGAGRAVIVGGELALSADVEADLREAGVRHVERIGGVDRFATAASVAREFGPGGVFVTAVDGEDLGESMMAASAAATARRPLLLVQGEAVPVSTADVLRELDAFAAVVAGGGVSGAARDSLAELVEVVDRVAGDVRPPEDGPSSAVAALADHVTLLGGNPATVWIASEDAWPDALAAASGAARAGEVLLVVDGRDLAGSEESREWLRLRGPEIEQLVIVGGEAAVSAAVAEQAGAIARDPNPPFEEFDVSVDMAAVDYGSGEPVEATVRACNRSNEVYRQRFAKPPDYRQAVTEASVGAVVATFRGVQTDAVYEREWEPGECKSPPLHTWDQRLGNQSYNPPSSTGPLAPAGSYRVVVQWIGEEDEAGRGPYSPPVASEPFSLSR